MKTFDDLKFTHSRDFFNDYGMVAKIIFDNNYGVRVTQNKEDLTKYSFQLLNKNVGSTMIITNKEFPDRLYNLTKDDITKCMKIVQLYNKK